jgi:hypothetical protein
MFLLYRLYVHFLSFLIYFSPDSSRLSLLMNLNPSSVLFFFDHIEVLSASSLQSRHSEILLDEVPTFTRTIPFLILFLLLHLEQKASVKRFVSLQFLDLRQSMGLLERGISPSPGRYLAQTQTSMR